MQAEKEKLIKGFIEYGKLSPALADRLWKLIEPFAAYGFNKAHAASYGRVAYQTAYLKANFPVEYMAAVLTAESGDLDTVAVMVAECKRMGIPILPPDINESFGDFTVIGMDSAGSPVTPQRDSAAGGGSEKEPESPAEAAQAIRFGLNSIKNFGRNVADEIIAERKRGGPFESLGDFLSRLRSATLNKKSLESLIACGALDLLAEKMGTERGALMANIERLLEYHRDAHQDDGQDSLFASSGLGAASGLTLQKAPEATMEQKLGWEKELLGLWISGHPLDKFKEQLAKRPMNLSEIKTRVTPGQMVVAAGMISDVRTILTRGGDQMAFVKLADYDGTLEAVVFPKGFAQYKDILKPESMIALKGRLSNRNGELSMVADALKAL
jgi:DNA polymerase-3 subunit alpha